MKTHLKFILLVLISVMASVGQAQHLHKHYEDLPCLNKNFNTLVHIPVDSAARLPIVSEQFVQELLEETSKFFEPICVSFTNCEINILEDNYNYSSIQNTPISVKNQMIKMNNMFSKDKRINIFISNYIDDYNCGLGTQHGIETKGEANVFIALKNCPDEPAVNLAHQLAHVLGLYDTYERGFGEENVDGSNCDTAGDQICDTPADPVRYTGQLDTMVVNCEFIHNKLDTNGDFYEPLVANIMSLYIDCKCGFTREQYVRMVEIYQNSPYKQF